LWFRVGGVPRGLVRSGGGIGPRGTLTRCTTGTQPPRGRSLVWGVGFRAWTSTLARLRVEGLGSRVKGSGFRIQGLGFRVQGLGLRVEGSGFRVEKL
jgi:hypothetical protein